MISQVLPEIFFPPNIPKSEVNSKSRPSSSGSIPSIVILKITSFTSELASVSGDSGTAEKLTRRGGSFGTKS